VDPHGDAAAASVTVVAGERTLASLIEFEIFSEGQGMGGNNKPPLQKCSKLFGSIGH
jgi:hypothetical protein